MVSINLRGIPQKRRCPFAVLYTRYMSCTLCATLLVLLLLLLLLCLLLWGAQVFVRLAFIQIHPSRCPFTVSLCLRPHHHLKASFLYIYRHTVHQYVCLLDTIVRHLANATGHKGYTKHPFEICMFSSRRSLRTSIAAFPPSFLYARLMGCTNLHTEELWARQDDIRTFSTNVK